jgi:hypothetical protein
MAKSLSPQEVSQMKDMIIGGVTPKDISAHWGIATSTVNYYKQQLKKEGVDLPSVRGRRSIPSAMFAQGMGNHGYQSPTAHYGNQGQPGPAPVPQQAQVGQYQQPGSYGTAPQYPQTMQQQSPLPYKSIILDGKHIQIDPSAKSMKILPDGSFEITF